MHHQLPFFTRVGDRCLGLQVELFLATGTKLASQSVVGQGDRTLRIAAANQPRRTEKAFLLDRLINRQDRLLLSNVDRDTFAGQPQRPRMFGRDDHHRLAHIEHPRIRQEGLVADQWAKKIVRHVVVREDGDDSRYQPGLLQIDPQHAATRHGTSHKSNDQFVLPERNVIEIRRFTRDVADGRVVRNRGTYPRHAGGLANW